MKLLKTFGILLIVIALFGTAMFGLNFVTGDRIAANKAAAQSGPLAEIMPEGAGFEEFDTTGLELPATITKVHKEINGKGFIFEVTVEGYKPGLVILCGIDAEGKITGSRCIQTNDTFQKEPEIDNKYNGQMLDTFKPVVISGATMTSNGYSAAIEAALQANIIVGGGELGPEVALKNMIPTLHPNFKDLKDVEITSTIAVKAYAPASGIGFAYVMVENDVYYLVVTSLTGACKVYNDAQADVTADHAALVEEATKLNAATISQYTDALKAKATQMVPGAADFASIDYPAFSSIVSAVSFKVDDAVHYGFYSRVIGYGNAPMEIFVILDENGAIVKTDATELILMEEHFYGFGGVPSGYKGGFVGITEGTWNNGEAAVIAGATLTTDAVKESVQNAFAAFKTIHEGGEQ